jgi:hypothetical protein
MKVRKDKPWLTDSMIPVNSTVTRELQAYPLDEFTISLSWHFLPSREQQVDQDVVETPIFLLNLLGKVTRSGLLQLTPLLNG